MAAKLTAAQDENCQTVFLRRGGRRVRSLYAFADEARADKGGTTFTGVAIAQLCNSLSGWFDRDVVDKSGMHGVFDIHVDAVRVKNCPTSGRAHPPMARRPNGTARPRFAGFQAALPKLGLKLEPARGPGEFLVVEAPPGKITRGN